MKVIAISIRTGSNPAQCAAACTTGATMQAAHLQDGQLRISIRVVLYDEVFEVDARLLEATVAQVLPWVPPREERER